MLQLTIQTGYENLLYQALLNIKETNTFTNLGESKQWIQMLYFQ